MKRLFIKPLWIVLTSVFAVLMIAMFIGGAIANSYSAAINSYFELKGYEQYETDPQNAEDTEYWKSAYRNEDGSLDNSKLSSDVINTAVQIQAEGTVLLWNNENALPLGNDERALTLLGRRSRKPVYAGWGSANGNLANGDDFRNQLQRDGFSVNGAVWDFYASSSDDNYDVGAGNDTGLTPTGRYLDPRELAWDGMPESTFADYPVAVVVFGRWGGEGHDLIPSGVSGTTDGDALSLSAEEIAILDNVTKSDAFEKVILVFNSTYGMNFKCIQPYMDDIDACLWMGNPGTYGLSAIGELLNGSVSPSAALADTLLYDNKSAPAVANYGNYQYVGSTTSYGGDDPLTYTEVKYMVYQEGIYVGYRYYETRYEDAVLGIGNATGNNGATDGSGWSYSEEVAFPFGHGLSYTTFSYSDVSVEEDGDNICASVTVTNAGGTYSGKEIVQLYMQRPYTDYDKRHGIEKPAAELVGFAKTETLLPGASETVEIVIDKECMRTYDAAGEGTYILEEGDYYFTIADDAHDAVNNILAAKGKTPSNSGNVMDADGNAAYTLRLTESDDYEIYSRSSATEDYEIVNRFDHADWNRYKGSDGNKITYLSRNDWQGTFPTTNVVLNMTERLRADLQYDKEVFEDPDAKMPTYGADNGLTLAMFIDTPFGDPSWDDLLDQMTYEEQALLCSNGFHQTEDIESVAKPQTMDNNGPMGCLGVSIQYPNAPVMAATFNTALLQRMGEMIGEQMLNAGDGNVRTGLYAPSANLHRTQYAGRNYEYFSEDPHLTEQIATYEVIGLQSKGCFAQMKHFIMNDQDWNRRGVGQWLPEQATRELYLAAFEDIVVVGEVKSVMSSFTRMGPLWCGADYFLLTEVLRGEWGFMGFVNSDCPDGPYMSFVDGIQAGNDTWDNSHDGSEYDEWRDSPTVMQCLRLASKRILYVTLHSNAMNGISTSTRIRSIRTWWQNAIIGIQIALTVLTALCAAMLVLSFVFGKKKNKNEKAAAAEAPDGEIQPETNAAESAVPVIAAVAAETESFAPPSDDETDVPVGETAAESEEPAAPVSVEAPQPPEITTGGTSAKIGALQDDMAKLTKKMSAMHGEMSKLSKKLNTLSEAVETLAAKKSERAKTARRKKTVAPQPTLRSEIEVMGKKLNEMNDILSSLMSERRGGENANGDGTEK